MKINYTDADGRIIELEVTDEVGQYYLSVEEEDKRIERRETRRHTPLSTFVYEDAHYFDSGINIEKQITMKAAVKAAMSKLSERQQYLLHMVCEEGWSYSDLARHEGKDESTIRKATEVAKKKFMKFWTE